MAILASQSMSSMPHLPTASRPSLPESDKSNGGCTLNCVQEMQEQIEEIWAQPDQPAPLPPSTSAFNTNMLINWLNIEITGRLQHIDRRLEEVRVLARYNWDVKGKPRKKKIRPGRKSDLGYEDASNGYSSSRPIGYHNDVSTFPSKATLNAPENTAPSDQVSGGGYGSQCYGFTSEMEQSNPDQMSHVQSIMSHIISTRSKKKGSDANESVRESMNGQLVRKGTTALLEIIQAHEYHRGHCAAKVWKFMENPYSSYQAYAYILCFETLVALSVFNSVWQTVDGYPLGHPHIVEGIFECIFALELFIRLVVCPDRWDFARDGFNYVDLLSILPLVFRSTVGILSASSDYSNDDDELARMAIVPVLRMLKLTRRFEKLRLLLSAFILALEALPVLLYTLALIALVFAGWVNAVEPTENFGNLPKALWFILVTMTTVGYGDITPTTTAGHIGVTVLILVSVLYMAIPIGIVGHAFSQVWNARDRLLLMQRMRRTFLQQGFGTKAMAEIVKTLDDNGDGELGPEEFQNMLRRMHINISDERILLLMESLDEDGSGTINVEELMDGLFPRYSIAPK